MVTARNLTKKFGDITALWDITFNIEPGEFVFLTGTSGSGKTTLFRLIMRNLGLTAGELVVDGKHVHKIKTKDLPAYRRRIGPVFQDFKLLPNKTAYENIASSVKIALEMVGLTDRSHLFPGQLSGGELQRVGLARAVVSKPKLILADEPTGNLDPKTAHSIVSLLKEIHEELKTTVIMATHNADIVNRFGLRVITLSEGKLIKDSPKGKYDE